MAEVAPCPPQEARPAVRSDAAGPLLDVGDAVPSPSAAAAATAAAAEAAAAAAGGHQEALPRGAARARQRSTGPLRRAARHCLSRSRAAGDRFLLSLVWRRGAVPDPLPEEARLQVRALRRPAVVCAVAILVAGVSQVWVALEGLMLLDRGVPKECDGLHAWLLDYQEALPNLPFLFLVAAPMLLWWAISGMRIRSTVPAKCKQLDPQLWEFVFRAFVCTVVTFVFIVMVFALGFWVRRQIHRIQRLWSGGGPTVDAVRQLVADGPPEDVPPETECTICLETRESTVESWRALPCGHQFHEHCLLEWLLRSHRCPLCRCDLHAVYLSRNRLSPAAGQSSGLPAPLSSHAAV